MLKGKKFFCLAGALIITVMLSGCLGLVQKPHIHVIGLTYANIAKESQTIGVELKIQNPNYFAIPIQTGTAVIKVNGNPFATGYMQQPIILPADSVVYATIPIHTTTVVLKAAIPAVIIAGGLAYSVKGSVVVQGHNTPFPFKYYGNLTIKQVEGLL